MRNGIIKIIFQSNDGLYIRLLNLGVDCFEIYSEIDEESKKQMIEKIKSFSSKNNQTIPIMYTLNYFHVYVNNIINNAKEFNFIPNSVLYITRNIEENKDMIKSLHNKNENDNSKVYYTIINTEPVLNFSSIRQDDIIHINFGDVSFKVVAIKDTFIKCIALNPGLIKKNNIITLYILF